MTSILLRIIQESLQCGPHVLRGYHEESDRVSDIVSLGDAYLKGAARKTVGMTNQELNVSVES